MTFYFTQSCHTIRGIYSRIFVTYARKIPNSHLMNYIQRSVNGINQKKRLFIIYFFLKQTFPLLRLLSNDIYVNAYQMTEGRLGIRKVLGYWEIRNFLGDCEVKIQRTIPKSSLQTTIISNDSHFENIIFCKDSNL